MITAEAVDVVLDCIVFDLQQGGGISRFWANLIAGLAGLPAGPRLHLLINAAARTDSALEVLRLARSHPRIRLYPYSARPLERVRRPAIPVGVPPRAVFHSSYYRSAHRLPNVLTIHDFTYEYAAGGWRAHAQHWQKSRSASQSAAVVCVSESTRQDFNRRFPSYDRAHVEVIHHGVEPHFTPRDGLAPAEADYVLFVGRRDSYKNFWLVAEAVARLPPLQLVVVGPPFGAAETARLEAALPGRCRRLPQVDDAALADLYRGASALAYPSRYEGFGLPVLEAMACGCPVIAMRASSIPEVAGNAAILLDEATPGSVAAALQALRDPIARAQMVSRGLSQARRFSWPDAAARYAATYAALSRTAP